MGCDTYIFAESRKDASAPWEYLGAPAHATEYRQNRTCRGDELPFAPWFDVRDNDVQRYLGWHTSGSRPPPDFPRDWPQDCSPELSRVRVPEHSVNGWFRASELLDALDMDPSFDSLCACLREMLVVSGRDPGDVRVVYFIED